jgi:hypothetical protein
MVKTFTRSAELRKSSEEVIRVSFQKSVHLTLEEVITIIRKCENLVSGRSFCFLADFTSAPVTFTTEARVYLSNNPTAKNRIADAIVVPNLTAKLKGDLYLRLHKPLVPTRFFTSEAKAEAWLQEMISVKTIHLN